MVLEIFRSAIFEKLHSEHPRTSKVKNRGSNTLFISMIRMNKGGEYFIKWTPVVRKTPKLSCLLVGIDILEYKNINFGG